MGDPPAGLLDEVARMLEEQRRGGAAPLRVRRREMVADVAGAERAQDRVGQRVEDDVGVAVAGKALVVRDMDAAEPELAAGGEGVDVEAEADARAEQRRLGAEEVGLEGQLLQRRIALDDGDREAGGARDLGVVGRLAAGPGAHGRARIASKRKACGVCTRNRSSRGTASPAPAPRQRVDHRQGGNGAVARRPARPSSRSITARGQEGPGGVVDQHALDAPRAALRGRSRTDCRRVAPPMIGAGRARSPIASR